MNEELKEFLYLRENKAYTYCRKGKPGVDLTKSFREGDTAHLGCNFLRNILTAHFFPELNVRHRWI